MNTINGNTTTVCTDAGTGIEINTSTGEATITSPNGSVASFIVDAFASGNGNGTTQGQAVPEPGTPPGAPSHLLVPSATVEDAANVVKSFSRSSGSSGSSGNSSSSSGVDSVPGSKWAKKLDELYAELENNPDMSQEDMQKLQMKMQQAMQMFQLFTQMMTAVYEAKKDAGRQIRY